MTTITDLCERLADACELKGVPVRANLQPGLTPEEIRAIVAPLGIVVPDELIELYGWRNGNVESDDWEDRAMLNFRDNEFISLERAVKEYACIATYYGVGSTLENDKVDLKACLPIAAFDGAWHVVACGAHLHDPRLDHPVISVFQGVDMHFHSVESMLKTCIGWVSSPGWAPCTSLDENEEMAIWRLYNPGIFA